MSQLAMFQLSENERQFLLQTARDSVRSYLAGDTLRLPELVSGVLTEPHGIFVSIHKHDELRGCIGNVHPVEPLCRTVAECAVAAAVGDPRFMPVTLVELPLVEFEISVLSPIERVEDVGEI